MRLVQLIGVALIVAGILAVVYNRFSYTKDETAASVGPVNITVAERQTVFIPDWAGLVAIVLGGAMVFAGSRRRV
jgi:uncharacterized membrane protein